jgi:hypothetical protein
MSVSQPSATGSREARRPRTTVGEKQVSVPGVVILVLFAGLVALLALYGLWSFWPAALPLTGHPPATATFSYFGWHRTLTRDQQFFVVAAQAGVIGSMLHGLRSLSRYVGERYLFRSWIAYYVLLPFVGALISTIVYLVLRAGFLPGAGVSSQPDPYGVAAIGALVGLFSAQAAGKLQAVFETLFTKAETGSEPITAVAMPAITSFRPSSGAVGTPVVIRGSNLMSVTGVEFTGAAAPQFEPVSESELTVSVPEGATTGTITLHADQERVTSRQDFTVTNSRQAANSPRRGQGGTGGRRSGWRSLFGLRD